MKVRGRGACKSSGWVLVDLYCSFAGGAGAGTGGRRDGSLLEHTLDQSFAETGIGGAFENEVGADFCRSDGGGGGGGGGGRGGLETGDLGES